MASHARPVHAKIPRLRKAKHSATSVPKAASSRHGGRHAKLSTPKAGVGAGPSRAHTAGTSTKATKSAGKSRSRHKSKVPGITQAQSIYGQEMTGEALAAQARGYTSPYASQVGLTNATTYWNIPGPNAHEANPNAAHLASHHHRGFGFGASPSRHSTKNSHGHKPRASKAKHLAAPKAANFHSLMGHASAPGINHMAWPQISTPAPHRTFQAK